MTLERKKVAPARTVVRVLIWTTFAVVLLLRYVVWRDYYAPRNTYRPNVASWQERQPRRFTRPPTVVPTPVSPVPKDLPRLEIEIAPKDAEILRGYYWNGMRGQPQERPEVLATVREGQTVYTNVAVHLKGAAGSFRPFDDKPALTLNFRKHAPGQRFHEYSKISLNNSVQDATYLCEVLCRELCLAAGVPVPRADWATVLINGRDLGLYVLLEGADKDFLRRHFKNVKGNLYDGGFCQDVNPNLEVSSGEKREDRSDIQRLLEVVGEPDPKALWPRLGGVLDLERFVSLLAFEVLTCHWDGYALNRNNYRLYHDPDSDRMVFIPHGLDQMFGLPVRERRSSVDSSIQPLMKGVVARAVMRTPEGCELYLERLEALRDGLLQEEALLRRVRELQRRIRPTLEAYDPAWAGRHDAEVATLCSHISMRIRSVDEQLRMPREPFAFAPDGTASLTNWTETYVPRTARFFLDQVEEEGRTLLRIAALSQGGSASWRFRALLEPGRYRFEGRARASAQAVGSRVSLRISGSPSRSGRVVAGTEWVPLAYDFETEGALSDVTLVCEFTGARGEVWFDASSLRLVRQ
jgi:DNA-binding transcriptional MerR regulator